MSEQESAGNRHRLRVWIKLAITSGLLDKLPPEYHPEGHEKAVSTESYARHLLAELRDPDSSKRTIKQIIADARQFQVWVEARQKDYRRLVLRELGYQRKHEAITAETRPSASTDREIKPTRTHVRSRDPASNPMWDDWLDA